MTCVDELPESVFAAPDRCVAVTVFELSTRVGPEAVAVVSTVAAPPQPGIVGGLLGARKVRHAPAFMVNALTDYAAGLVCPLLLPENLSILLDDRLPGDEEPVYTPTGERYTALAIRAFDLVSLLPGKSVDLRIPHPRGPREAIPVRH
ncbi:YbaK/EbsC family protein [Thermoactinospora rubra]|uniref:YbaK/EbsC family protein n=1 Tax=Thermoactinospora rubra TaxID=1088767 RepID=UPI001F0AD0D4|nr:YbaK/EbsC family protein [Thermoactinospora rubra]